MPHRRLIVVGSGTCANLVAAAAAGAPNIELRPPVSSDELIELMQSARAFVFAAEEDFGITMVEAQACGTPVIAFGKGGACDIVADENSTRPTGVLFREQTTKAIEDAVARFEAIEHQISPVACRRNAEQFSVEIFRQRMLEVVADAMSGRTSELYGGTEPIPQQVLPEVFDEQRDERHQSNYATLPV